LRKLAAGVHSWHPGIRWPLGAFALVLLLALPARASAASGTGPVVPGPVSVVQTSANLSQALSPLPAIQFTATPPATGVPVVAIDDAVGYQRVEGFGAAMTDSSAWLLEHGLAPTPRAQLLSGLFSPTGLDLDFLRVPIGASDFTVGGVPYSYDDVPPGQLDPALRHFSIAHDRAYIIPALKAARALNPQLNLLASPWSPPAWMKHNDALSDVAGRGTLRAIAYGPWAAYIVRFLRAYGAAGVPINALTLSNEPGNPTSYPGLDMSPGSIAIWLSHFLVPALRAAHLKIRLYGGDSGWGKPPVARAAALGLGRSALTGVAWHCYFGSPGVMAQLHVLAPTLDQIVDECSPGISAIPISEVVIASLRDWASTVALWNLALNPSGGPVEEPNTGCPGCSGLAKINPLTDSFLPTLAWYQLGQASRFVQTGALRVESNTFVTYNYVKRGVNFISPSIDDVAFVNPNGTRVLLAYNNSTAPVTFAVSWQNQYFEYTLPAGATVTFQWTVTG
jgi:glucosylceramidase